MTYHYLGLRGDDATEEAAAAYNRVRDGLKSGKSAGEIAKQAGHDYIKISGEQGGKSACEFFGVKGEAAKKCGDAAAYFYLKAYDAVTGIIDDIFGDKYAAARARKKAMDALASKEAGVIRALFLEVDDKGKPLPESETMRGVMRQVVGDLVTVYRKLGGTKPYGYREAMNDLASIMGAYQFRISSLVYSTNVKGPLPPGAPKDFYKYWTPYTALLPWFLTCPKPGQDGKLPPGAVCQDLTGVSYPATTLFFDHPDFMKMYVDMQKATPHPSDRLKSNQLDLALMQQVAQKKSDWLADLQAAAALVATRLTARVAAEKTQAQFADAVARAKRARSMYEQYATPVSGLGGVPGGALGAAAAVAAGAGILWWLARQG